MTEKNTLDDILNACPRAAIALAGGVDSMTLAHAAHRTMGERVTMVHARSPAVPEAATTRVRDHAARHSWQLVGLDAGEFHDENYLNNPANRCYFCKSNLYATLAEVAGSAQLFSGTNLDDLGDWRPGLQAAKQHDVRHPFVEAGLAKEDVRALARRFGLSDIAELPAAPCLSSRMETGLRIEAQTLQLINTTEVKLQQALNPQTVRCRVRANGIMIELDAKCLEAISAEQRTQLAADIEKSFASLKNNKVAFAPYRQGSAFLRETLKKDISRQPIEQTP